MTSTIVSRARPTKASVHVGAVGDVVNVLGVIRKIVGSGKALYVIHDADGNEFEMRCTRYQAPGSGLGVLVDVTATVIGHGEYAGVRRTELSPGKCRRAGDDHPFLASR